MVLRMIVRLYSKSFCPLGRGKQLDFVFLYGVFSFNAGGSRMAV